MDTLENYFEKLSVIDNKLAELDSGRCPLPMYGLVELRRRQLLKRRAVLAKEYYFAFAKQKPSSLWIVDRFEKDAPIFIINQNLNCTDAVKKLCKLYGLDCDKNGIREMEKYGFCNTFTQIDVLGNCTTTEMATPLGQIRLLTSEKLTSQIAKNAQLAYKQREELHLH